MPIFACLITSNLVANKPMTDIWDVADEKGETTAKTPENGAAF